MIEDHSSCIRVSDAARTHIVQTMQRSKKYINTFLEGT